MEKRGEERDSFESKRNYNIEQKSLMTRRERRPLLAQHPESRGVRESWSQEKGLVPDRSKESGVLESCTPSWGDREGSRPRGK